MSSFVNAMDNMGNRQTIPEKPGTMVRTTVGHDLESKLLELWVMLKRGSDAAEISERVQRITSAANGPDRAEVLTLLCRLIMQKRDCRNGGGERDVVFAALLGLRETMPATAAALIRLLPQFGYFKDLTHIATKCKEIKDTCLLAECVTAIAAGVRAENTLAVKWAPREKKAHSWLAKLVACELGMSKATYRKHLSKVMESHATSIPEVLMSGKRWREVEPSKVPSRCLKVHRRAFLDEDKKGARRHVEDEDPDLADREICRTKFQETMEKAAKGEGPALKGARNFPYQLVADVRENGVPSILQRQSMNAMWSSIVEDVKRQIAEQKVIDAEGEGEGKSEETSFDPSRMVPMSDVSGSMTCCKSIPMNNSIAMGMLLAEVGHPAFRGRVLTFHTNPSWVVFQESDDFCDRVQKLAQAPWGGSTNFEAAMGLIATVVRENSLPEEEVPGITCFSDMKFDSARGYGSASWQTHYERIQVMFAQVGKEISGKAYAAPRICFWDLANQSHGGGQPGFPVTAHDEGVQLISGFSPALLKLVMTGERLDTPFETFLKAVRDTRYDVVEELALRAMEIDPSFVAVEDTAEEKKE